MIFIKIYDIINIENKRKEQEESVEVINRRTFSMKFVSVDELIAAAGQGFAELDTDAKSQEKSDLCWKISKSLRD